MLIFETMPIWSNPEDEHYRGPCTYRLIVNGQNYCGKTFHFHKRMINHKSKSKFWKKEFEEGYYIQDVHVCISDGWDDVVIEILARYPDKIKDVEADGLYMNEREIEAITLYNSYHNGLNMTPGGNLMSDAQKKELSQRMLGKSLQCGSKDVRYTERRK